MSNLYDKLEVSKNASKEVIDKAYHVLVKKYHPDLQQSEKEKKIAEEKIKEINDAYEILSDQIKRKEYDLELEKQIEEQKRQQDMEKFEILERMKQQEINLKTKQQEINNQFKNNNDEYANLKRMQDNINESYRSAYYNYLRRLGYKIKEPWTWKKLSNMLISIGIILGIIIIVWIFPPTHKIIVDFYEKNFIIKTLADIIINIIRGIGEGIGRFFKNLF